MNRSHDSAVAAHLLESGHAMDNIDVVLLHEENSFNRRLTLETLDIYKHRAKNHTLSNEFIPELGLLKKLYA